MKPSHIYVVVRKQLKSTFRNGPTLVQPVMFSAVVAILALLTSEFELPKRYFVSLFSTVYVCIAPIPILSMIISEERERDSLHTSMTSSIEPMGCLLDMRAYVFVLCMAGILFVELLGKFSLQELWVSLLLSVCGILASPVIDALIGVVSSDQTAINNLSVPTVLLTSFIPMLSVFDVSIRGVGRFLYFQQIYKQINSSSTIVLPTQSFVVILINLALVLVLYVCMCGKGQLLAL